MQVTKLTEEMKATPKHQYTEEELSREYHYILSEQITKKLLKKGLISEEQYEKIMAKNRQIFMPVFSELYPTESLIYKGFRVNMSPNESEVS